MSASVTHGFGPAEISGGEFTMCGLAFDAFDSGDADEPVIFAEPGKRITCPVCLGVIAHYKSIRNNCNPKD